MTEGSDVGLVSNFSTLRSEMRFPTTVVLFVLTVITVSAILLVVSSSALSWDLFPQILLFTLLVVVASYLIVEDPAGGVVSATGTLFYVAIYVFSPVDAFFVVSLGYAIGNTLPRSWVTWRACFNGAQMGLSVLLGSLVYRGLGGHPGALAFASQVLPSVLGPLIHQMANNFFVGFVISQVRGVSFVRTWVSFVRDPLWSNLLTIPTAILIAILYTRVHHAFVLVFLVSLPFQRWATILYLKQRGIYTKIIESLVRAGELSLPGTTGHARRVADLSVAIGRELGLIERDIESIEFGALLHDIGMIGLDDALASGSAHSDSRRWIDAHVQKGSEIVGELPRREIAQMVLDHHTAFSGTSGRGGRERKPISVATRIIALAEEVDSRLHGLFPYSEAQSLESVLRFVASSRGTMFDPRVVDAFVRVVRKEATAGLADLSLEELPSFAVEGINDP